MKIQPRPSQPVASASESAPAAPVEKPATAAVRADRFVDTGREGGTGALGLADPSVAAARTVAQEHARDRVFGEGIDRGAALNHLGQIDSDRGGEAGGSDAIRCSTSSLVAGAVLLGPDATERAIDAVQERGRGLLQQYREVQTLVGEESGVDSTEYRELTAHIHELEASQDALASLSATPAGDLRVEDLHRLQETVFTQALYDQRLQVGTVDGEPRDLYTTIDGPMLTTGTMQTYRDVMWGDGVRPEMNGERLDAFFVDNEAGGGHFVLANEAAGEDGSRSIAFNPWPDADGTAFTRASDGEGARVVPESGRYVEGSRLRGVDVDSEGVRLPPRAFIEE